MRCMFKFSRWVGINIILPLTPFFLRSFISFFGREQINILEMPDLLFFSIFTCITALNINMDDEKKNFEKIIRLFFIIIGALDLIILSMLYSKNAGQDCIKFSIASAIITAVITPIYKLYYMKRKEVHKNEIVRGYNNINLSN